MVKIDVFLVFRIVNPRQFIMNLSPEKLGDLLKAAQEESVRNILRTTRHDKVYDLMKFDETPIIAEMCKRFEPFGVEISDMMITNVALPPGMAHSLESETTYQIKRRLQKRTQEFDLLVQNDNGKLKALELQQQNTKLSIEEEAKKQRAIVSKELSEIEARTAKRLAEIKAEEDAIVRKISEQANLIASQKNATKDASLQEALAVSTAQRQKLRSEQDKYVEQTRSSAQLSVAEMSARALKLEADAEEQSATKLAAKRQQEIQAKQFGVLGELALNKDAVFSGSTNGNVVAQVAAANYQKEIYQLI